MRASFGLWALTVFTHECNCLSAFSTKKIVRCSLNSQGGVSFYAGGSIGAFLCVEGNWRGGVGGGGGALGPERRGERGPLEALPPQLHRQGRRRRAGRLAVDRGGRRTRLTPEFRDCRFDRLRSLNTHGSSAYGARNSA